MTTSAFPTEDRTGVQGRETETEGNDEAGEEGVRGAGGGVAPSPAPPVRSVRRQFTLDLSVVNSPRNRWAFRGFRIPDRRYSCILSRPVDTF